MGPQNDESHEAHKDLTVPRRWNDLGAFAKLNSRTTVFLARCQPVHARLVDRSWAALGNGDGSSYFPLPCRLLRGWRVCCWEAHFELRNAAACVSCRSEEHTSELQSLRH